MELTLGGERGTKNSLKNYVVALCVWQGEGEYNGSVVAKQVGQWQVGTLGLQGASNGSTKMGGGIGLGMKEFSKIKSIDEHSGHPARPGTDISQAQLDPGWAR